MRNRLNQIMRFLMIIGAVSLIGCATQIPTTSQWGVSKGFQRIDLKGKEYFCRVEPTSPPSKLSNVSCLTYVQLQNLRMHSEGTTEFAAFAIENNESEGQ
jgi:hypothetical protein